MMLVAGCAVVFNITLGLVLHGLCKIPHSHSHGHGHSHNHLEKGREHLTSSSKLHSDSETDSDDFEDSLRGKQVRQSLTLFGSHFFIFIKRNIGTCYSE